MKFRKVYERRRVSTDVEGDSMTKQSFKDESDINFIMRKYQQTGFLNPALLRKAEYMEASNLSFQEAMNIVISAQSDFDSLPAELRKRFGNDPAEFLDFVGNDENLEEMRKLGLVETLVVDDEEPSPPASDDSPPKGGDKAPGAPSSEV
jgi:phage internal scaffolding protein